MSRLRAGHVSLLKDDDFHLKLILGQKIFRLAVEHIRLGTSQRQGLCHDITNELGRTEERSWTVGQ
jgi:hypothetical protein